MKKMKAQVKQKRKKEKKKEKNEKKVNEEDQIVVSIKKSEDLTYDLHLKKGFSMNKVVQKDVDEKEKEDEKIC